MLDIIILLGGYFVWFPERGLVCQMFVDPVGIFWVKVFDGLGHDHSEILGDCKQKNQ